MDVERREFMTRQFKTIADAVPHTFRYAGTHGGEGNVEVVKETGERMRIDTPIFTAAETAHLMREYGKVVRYATKAHWLIKLYFEGDPKRKRRYYRFFCRCLKVRGEIEAKMVEWEKSE